ncbi:MAG: hypothetical protein U0228_13070 [Myxococcaceae bacterium]
MTDLEAIEVLQDRAKRFARAYHVSAGVLTVVGALLLWALLIGVSALALGVITLKWTFFAAFAASIAIVPRAVGAVLKRRLAAQRAGWIDELVKTEGARRDVLEASFTLDSW